MPCCLWEPQIQGGGGQTRASQTKSGKKDREARPEGPKATDGPPEGVDPAPPAQVDLMGDLSKKGAPPPTPSQEEGWAAPEDTGKAQDGGEQRGHSQKSPVRVRWATLDCWETL
jgi:hypothetical protein